jgi:hypothetical protein
MRASATSVCGLKLPAIPAILVFPANLVEEAWAMAAATGCVRCQAKRPLASIWHTRGKKKGAKERASAWLLHA